MKNIKIILVMFLLGLGKSNAQLWNVLDPKVAAEKAVVAGSLNTETTSRDKLTANINEMTRLELEYDAKRKGATAGLVTLGLAMTQTIAEITKLLVDTKKLIRKIESNPINFHTRVKDHKVRLQKLEEMMKETAPDVIFIGTGLVPGTSSGGPGYSYTACQKMLKYILTIKRRVVDINYKVKNITTLNNIYKK